MRTMHFRNHIKPVHFEIQYNIFLTYKLSTQNTPSRTSLRPPTRGAFELSSEMTQLLYCNAELIWGSLGSWHAFLKNIKSTGDFSKNLVQHTRMVHE